MPLEGISVDPCQLDAEGYKLGSGGGGGRTNLDDEPRSMRSLLSYAHTFITHIVVRGTYLPDTVRCTTGNPYRPPSYLSNEQYGDLIYAFLINCYVDLQVGDYILGDGPSTLTVLRHFISYRVGAAQAVYIEEHQGISERAFFEDFSQQQESDEYLGGTAGREEVLFIGPSSSLSVEVWKAFRIWDVQQQEDGTVIAVHPDRDWWRLRPDVYLTHQSTLEMELPAFKQAVTEAHQARVDENDGRILPEDIGGIVEGVELPMLISNVDELDEYYTAVGSYDHPDGPPAQPPPVPACANGTVITDPGSNRGLVNDCEVMLAAKDTLQGTATLNWSADTVITSWDGVTVSGTPGRVRGLDLSDEGLDGAIPGDIGDLYELTVLDLSDNSLTGDIPVELGWLYNLEEVSLSGNTLTGCIPVALESAATNDLPSLNLLYCQPPSPDNVILGTPGAYSVEVSWDAVPNTSKYQVEYYNDWLSDWVVDDDTITGTTHTVDGLYCGRKHWFQVRAYGSGATYTAVWSEPSNFLRETTAECETPVFGEESYAFSVTKDASVDDVVGRVSATSRNGTAVTYSITFGNLDGFLDIDGESGEIKVAADLTGRSGRPFNLTVKAEEANRGAVYAKVTITVTDVAEDQPPAP